MSNEKRVRNLSWKDYGMSKNLQDELKAFCLQYDEKKQRIIHSFQEDEYKKCGRGVALPVSTEHRIAEKDRLKYDCEMIEEAAEFTSKELAPYLLKCVTKDLTYELLEYDKELGRIPVGKTDFYGYRRRFFYFLHKIKIGDDMNVCL